jgi:CBS domain-containing protein
LRQYSASQLMVSDPPVVEGAMSVGSLARGVLELNPRVCYFVEDEGRLAGILSSYQLRAVPEQLWDSTTAAQVMVPSQRLKATGPESPVSDVLLEMEASNLLHMPVVREGRVIGVIGRDRILGVLRNAGLLGRA